MEITPVQCLTDNYAYIINDKNSKTVGVVDPSEATPIIKSLEKKKLKLNYILNTHHHFDHIGGNDKLKKLYKAKVVGFDGDKHRIPGIDITLKNNEKWIFGNSTITILHIPGHTLGHICFFFEKEKIAFTGDTLFSLFQKKSRCDPLYGQVCAISLFLNFQSSNFHYHQELYQFLEFYVCRQRIQPL